MPWVSTRSQTSCAPLGFPHHPSRLLCRRYPEAFWGPLALQTRLERKRLLGLERWGRELERFKSRHRGCTCACCASTYMPRHTHTHAHTYTPISSCLLALLALISLCFPEAAPTSGTAEPRTAPQPPLQRGEAKSPIQTCASSAPHF